MRQSQKAIDYARTNAFAGRFAKFWRTLLRYGSLRGLSQVSLKNLAQASRLQAFVLLGLSQCLLTLPELCFLKIVAKKGKELAQRQ